MIDPRRVPALTNFLVSRLRDVHGGVVDDSTGPDIPRERVMIHIGELIVYVQPDPGEPTSGRSAMPDTVLLTACAATVVVDIGAAEAAIHSFRSDPSTPPELRVSTTSRDDLQVWLDLSMPSTTSFDVAAASLDDFMRHATRLRAAVEDLDLTTSFDARERAKAGFSEPVSYDLLDESEWSTHPWLSRLQRNTDMDAYSYLCLYDLPQAAVTAIRRIELQVELNDGTWERIEPERSAPQMPGMHWEKPDIAWPDPFDGGRGRPDDPTGRTGRMRARIPTGWVGPPT